MAEQKRTAQDLGKNQKDISISEFFAKNRHLLGFDNPTKAVLTTVKEAVDNALDACEESGIKPEILVTIRESTSGGTSTKLAPVDGAQPESGNKDGAGHFIISVEDNGPGILRKHVQKVFGKLLYGSKFHRLRQSRGQQGIGISAAGMYGLMTTHKPVKISSKTGKNQPTYYCELKIDTKNNMPQALVEKEIAAGEGGDPNDPLNPEILMQHGTRVSIELLGEYRRGRTGVDEYIRQTAISNPHAKIVFQSPAGRTVYPSVVNDLPPEPKEIKPHPYGIELGQLGNMLTHTTCSTLTQFLQEEFSKVSGQIAGQIILAANNLVKDKDITPRSRPSLISKSNDKLRALFKSIQSVKIQRPNTNILAPIGEAAIIAGLKKEIRAEFYTAKTRPPAVYRGNPFLIEVGLAFGGDLQKPDPEMIDPEQLLNLSDDFEDTNDDAGAEDRSGPARIIRFANRVPLQYKQSDCAITKSIMQMNWRSYGLSQRRGQLPVGPLEVMIHIASVWVPFTSESKEAVANYDEIRKEIKLCLGECARRLGSYVRKRRNAEREAQRRRVFELYIEEVVQSVARIKGDEVDTNKLREQLVSIARAKTDAELDNGETEPEPPSPDSGELDIPLDLADDASDDADDADVDAIVSADDEMDDADAVVESATGSESNDAAALPLFGLTDSGPAKRKKRGSSRRKKTAG
ncbi:MAG: DNA topoisomerase VI subunit B [Planctomycetota bacterium]